MCSKNEKNRVKMSQNYKNDDLGYMWRRNQIKKRIAENIPKIYIHNGLQVVDEQNNVNNKYIMKYKKDIEDIAKQVCYCCQNLCFAHQVFYVSKSCIEQFPDVIKNVKLTNMC